MFLQHRLLNETRISCFSFWSFDFHFEVEVEVKITRQRQMSNKNRNQNRQVQLTNKKPEKQFNGSQDRNSIQRGFHERFQERPPPGPDLFGGPGFPPPFVMIPPSPMNYPMGPMGYPGMPPPAMSGSGFPIPFLAGGPTYDLPIKEKEDAKKFTGRCRLFVAGISPNIKEEDIKTLFEEFGEVSEVFIGKGNAFAFVKMDTKKHAEEARDSLDNKHYEGRILRVRLAAHAAAVRVKNLSQVVSNELLEYAFSYFGEVERAVVITDERGRSVGEGVVEFARKNAALICLKRCQQECFLLTANPAPVIVEPYEQRDEEEGFSERHVNRNSVEFKIEREAGPRFADPLSFEYDFGCRFKQLYEIEREKRARLENEINEARHALMGQLEHQRMEHEKKMLKEKLKQMEEKTSAYVGGRSRTIDDDKAREEERQRQEKELRQREEELLRRSQFPPMMPQVPGYPDMRINDMHDVVGNLLLFSSFTY